MITKLHIKNFKSWKDTGELIFAPLTGFFGTNSSGKTSILQVLLMLKQTVESPDRKRVLNTGDNRSIVDLGMYYDIFYGHKLDEVLEIQFAWDFHRTVGIPLGREIYGIRKPIEIDSLKFNTKIKIDNDKLANNEKHFEKAIVDEFFYLFSEKDIDSSSTENKIGMKKSEKNQYKLDYDLRKYNYEATRQMGRAWPLPPPIKCYAFPDEVYSYYRNVGFFSKFILLFEKLFSEMFYLGPLREYPKRSYVWAGDTPENVGIKGELAIPALLASRNIGKMFSPGSHMRKMTVEERVAYWLKTMGMIDKYELKPIADNRKEYEFHIMRTSTSPYVLITDIGFGVSQILPILVLCYYVPEHSIIILEQPEIHLHPSVQAFLADVFIEVVTRRNIQIILESHSEHLLRRLQRRIAEQKIEANKTALYFCNYENSSSAIEKLEVDLFGNIENWPKDFFGDELGDLVEKTKAEMNFKQ